jgi:hypothetical protein
MTLTSDSDNEVEVDDIDGPHFALLPAPAPDDTQGHRPQELRLARHRRRRNDCPGGFFGMRSQMALFLVTFAAVRFLSAFRRLSCKR